jgi:hypothetical protein
MRCPASSLLRGKIVRLLFSKWTRIPTVSDKICQKYARNLLTESDGYINLAIMPDIEIIKQITRHDPHQLSPRQCAALRLRNRGLSYHLIGRVMDISSGAARANVKCAEMKMKRILAPPNSFDKLSGRAQMVLRNGGLETLDDIRDAFNSGRLRIGMPHGCGVGIFAEIRNMLRA